MTPVAPLDEPSPPPPPRSAIVTAIAWVAIAASAVFAPISLISLLMIIARSYGTSTFDPLGFLTVIVAPLATLVAGFGLLRRKRWARAYMLVLLTLILAFNVYGIFEPAKPPTRHVSPDGVLTTVYADGGNYSLHIIAGCVGALMLLLSPRVRREFAAAPAPVPLPLEVPVSAPASAFEMMQAAVPVPPSSSAAARTRGDSPQSSPSDDARGWRVGHAGRDYLYYEERRDGAWHRLDIEGGLLTGRAHHAVYFASPEGWQRYPEWARNRRGEIIARVKSEFREPDYEYQASGVVPSADRRRPAPARASRRFAPLLVAAALLALAGAMAWLVYDGTASGETVLPIKQAWQRRSVSRRQEPISFWLSIAVYAAVGLGSVGLVGWGVAVTRRNE